MVVISQKFDSEDVMKFRKQYDDDKSYSESCVIKCSEEEDKTRQEFKDEADVNKLLSRYGVNVPQLRPVYGEVDTDIDLQGAYLAAQEVADRLTPEQLEVLYTGKAPAAPEVPSGVDGASASPERGSPEVGQQVN